MKKVLSILLVLVLGMAVFTGCGQTDTSAITAEEVNELYTNPNSFKGRTFDFSGKILQVEKSEGKYAIQAWYDVKNYDKNTIIYYTPAEGENFSPKEDDFIKASGTIGNAYTGENYLGGKVTAPTLDATKAEIVSYAEAVDPAEKTIELNKTSKKGNASLTIEKIELTDNETRVYVTLKNNGDSSISFYSFNAKLIQNGEQKSIQDNFEANYPTIEDELYKSTKSTGIIAFPSIDKEKDFTLKFPFFDNENYNEYTFTFNIENK